MLQSVNRRTQQRTLTDSLFAPSLNFGRSGMFMLKIAPLFALCIAFALSSAVNGSDENVVQGQRVRMSVTVLDYK